MDRSISRGLTPAQIKKAIYGENKKPERKADKFFNKKRKPSQTIRLPQQQDNALLLRLPFSTTEIVSQYKTPDWFTSIQKADVSVIVPLYGNNASRMTQSWDHKNDGLKVEIIFVDDNCPRSSKDLVMKEWQVKKDHLKAPVGRIYLSSVTQGWGACCNAGAEKATGNIIVFLHPDTILTEGWLRPLVRMARKNTVGVVSPMTLEEDARTVNDSGSSWSWEEERFVAVGREVYKDKKLSKPLVLGNMPEGLLDFGEREKISSYCMAVRRDLFRNMGGFSPNLTLSDWSDADFCMLVKERGLSVIVQGKSQVFRARTKSKEDEKGRIYFKNKWITSGRVDSLVSQRRLKAKKDVESIVIRRAAAHGDVLLAASVVAPLKIKYPKAKIVFSTDCPDVVVNNPGIDNVVSVYSERWFDLYFDLDMVYEYRPNVNFLTAYAEAVGVKPSECQHFMHCDPIDGLPDRYAVVHAGKTMWAGRDWSSSKFDIVAKRLQTAGFKVVCVGIPFDHKTPCDFDLRGSTTISQLGTVIKNAKLFVGIDSFPMHIAQIFSVPGVCFFGSVRPDTRLLASSSIRPVVADGVKCLGCHHKKPTPCTATITCDVGIQDCVNNVSADHMWKAIESVIVS
jgi:ADP-heptose:LPS heptosyltransferase/GT2 family glycosyltransferase